MVKTNRFLPVWMIVLALIMLSGCARTIRYEDILWQAQTVDPSDGIDEGEAVILAQQYLIENNFDQEHSVYEIQIVEPLEDGIHWLVVFRSGVNRGNNPRRQFDYVPARNIVVDKTTGFTEIALEQHYE